MHIVYFSHALMLAVHGRFLIKQEIEAWRDGPAVPVLHRSVRKYGEGPVTERIDIAEEQYDQHEIDMISNAVRLHTAQGGARLAAAVTSNGSPWYRKWHNSKDQSVVIPARDIQTFHKKMFEQWKRKKAKRTREARVDHSRNCRAPEGEIPEGEIPEGETRRGIPGRPSRPGARGERTPEGGQRMGDNPTLTIGHSNHTAQVFAQMVSAHGVQEIVDVRSTPESRHVPHFNRAVLTKTLDRTGVRYSYMGRELGGRPRGDEFYDEDGRVQYEAIAQTQDFQDALEIIALRSRERIIAVMCTERDPLQCHRTLLVAHHLSLRGMEIEHITGTETSARTRHADLMKRLVSAWPQSQGQETAGEEIRMAIALQSRKVGYARRAGGRK